MLKRPQYTRVRDTQHHLIAFSSASCWAYDVKNLIAWALAANPF